MSIYYSEKTLYLNIGTKGIVTSRNSSLLAPGSTYSSVPLNLFAGDANLIKLNLIDESNNPVAYPANAEWRFCADSDYTYTGDSNLLNLGDSYFNKDIDNGWSDPATGKLSIFIPTHRVDLFSTSSFTLHCSLWMRAAPPESLRTLIGQWDFTVLPVVLPDEDNISSSEDFADEQSSSSSSSSDGTSSSSSSSSEGNSSSSSSSSDGTSSSSSDGTSSSSSSIDSSSSSSADDHIITMSSTGYGSFDGVYTYLGQINNKPAYGKAGYLIQYDGVDYELLDDTLEKVANWNGSSNPSGNADTTYAGGSYPSIGVCTATIS